MRLDQKTDEELLLLYQKGQEEAFQVLYRRHSGRFYAYLQKRLRDPQEVSDLFQEFFVRLHRSKHLYDPSFPALPWMFTVLRNLLIDDRRKASRRARIEDSVPQFEHFEATDHLPLTLDSNLSVALEALTPDHREAVRSRYLEDQSFEEIAQRLQTSPANVRQILHRAIKKMRRFLSEEEK